jgi:RHS repeat-associated protein
LKVTTTNAFDVYGRLTGITQTNGTGVFSADSYVLDNLDRLKTETKDGQSRSIGYDSIDQVKTVTGSNNEAYTYDLNGNRINTGYVTGADNRLMSDGVYNYQYDAEGNRTKRTKLADNTVDNYTWDYRNRLVSIVSKNAAGSVNKTVGYEYDVDDQRVKKTVDGVVENYFIDRNQIAFVTDGSGHETFHYLYGLNVDSVMAQDSPAGMVWALADRLGSIDTLTDKDGNVVDRRSFDSFGRVLSETNPSVSFRYGYTARERDLESGLSYYRARYYDPRVGQFISVDPMGFGAGDTNLYRYVGNSATLATDPSGMIAPLLAFGIAVALGGLFGAGYGVANHLDNGGSFSNIDGQDIWEKATIGALGGAVVATGAAAIGAGLTAAGVAASTVQAGGLIFGAAGTGWSIGSGINNFANGKPWTGALDFLGAGLGIKGLVSGYQGYRQTLTNENIARSGVVYDVPGNPRPISQVGDSQLNSSGQIVPAGSSALANRTSVGGAIIPYGNNAGGALVLGNSASSAIAQATSAVTGQSLIPTDPFSLYLQHPNYPDLSRGAFGKLDGYIAKGEVQLIRSTPYDLQTATTIRNNIINSGINKLSTRYSDSKGNIAFAEGTINGNNIPQIRAFSGKEHLQGYTNLPKNSQLVSEKLGRLDRKIDSESKILERLLEITKEGDVGTIKLFSEHFVCSSCGGMIEQFKNLRPHIKIIISTGE